MKALRFTTFIVLGVMIVSTEAHGFGVDFNTRSPKPRGIVFETDVIVKAQRLEKPLRSGLFLAWQSQMEDAKGELPGIGGHWGFQLLPGSKKNKHNPIFTFNFGWGFNAAVLPLKQKALVRSMKKWHRL